MPILKQGASTVLFSHIPKCGGTSVENFCKANEIDLALMDEAYFGIEKAERWSVSSPQHIDGLSLSRLFPPGFFEHAFAVVRHPIDRFVSAFNYQQGWEKTISSELSISEFATSYLDNAIKRDGQFDNHFVPAWEFFLPGTDYTVFKLEEGLDSVKTYLDKYFCLEPETNIGFDNAKRTTELSQSGKDLSPSAVQNLLRVYQRDFEYFEY